MRMIRTRAGKVGVNTIAYLSHRRAKFRAQGVRGPLEADRPEHGRHVQDRIDIGSRQVIALRTAYSREPAPYAQWRSWGDQSGHHRLIALPPPLPGFLLLARKNLIIF